MPRRRHTSPTSDPHDVTHLTAYSHVMGLAGIPKPPRFARRVLPVVWPVGAAALTGLATPVIVAGAFHAFVDKRARLFRVSCLGVGLIWVDVRMLMDCWRLQLKN